MSANAAKSGTPSSRAMSCAPGDSGPNLYSKIPSMSVPCRPASDSGRLGRGEREIPRIGCARAAQVRIPDTGDGDRARQRAHEVVSDSRNCGSVTPPRSSNTTSTGMPHASACPGRDVDEVGEHPKSRLVIELDEGHHVGQGVDESRVQRPVHDRVRVDHAPAGCLGRARNPQPDNGYSTPPAGTAAFRTRGSAAGPAGGQRRHPNGSG